VPARRVELTGLPPAWIGVGTIDLFHDEDVAYAKRLQACGVGCELMTVPGAFHGFDGANPSLPIARAFRQAQIEALKKHLFPPVSER
jgi:acetyl esterase/lipase